MLNRNEIQRQTGQVGYVLRINVCFEFHDRYPSIMLLISLETMFQVRLQHLTKNTV